MNITKEHSLLSEIFSNLGQMVWSKDIATGRISFLTNNFSSVFEVPMDMLRMDPTILKTAIHPEDVPFVDVFSKNLLSNGEEQIEYRIVTPSGKIKWILDRKQIVKNDLGEIIRLDVLLTDISAQKSEELKLLESETAFKSLFFKNPQPMWVYDVESLGFLAVNDSAIRFYGYTQDEFFRMTIRQIRPKEDVPIILQVIENQEFPGERGRTWRHQKKDGSLVFVKIFSTEIYFRGKRSRLVLSNDVTSEVEAEANMEKANRYLEQFQEAVSRTSLLCIIDQFGNMVFINQNLLDRKQMVAADLIGKNFSTLYSNKYKPEKLQEIWTDLKAGKVWKGERKFSRKKGPHFWTNCSIIPIQDESGKPVQYLLIADDITNLKEAESMNKDIAVRLHDILESVTDAIFVVDRNWNITNLNQESENLLQKSTSQLIGKNIWEVFPEEEVFKYYQFFRKAKKRKITVQFEEYFQPKDQWYDISLYPSKDGLAVCFRNVSDRRKQDQERKEMLEQLIAQNRDLEEFTYIASHSLRAQIANISMLCSAMDGNGMTPSNLEIFERLFQSSSNLDTIIADLNTILTVKDHSAVLFEDLLFQNSCINAISKISNNYGAFKKSIRTEIEPGLKIYSVRNYIETILFQLISNALRFRSVVKQPDILVKAWKDETNFFLSVSDNGKGMDLNKIHKQVFQLYKTFDPGVSGKGLGLYLCKILVEELKGNISIQSSLSMGTMVEVKIPLAS